MAPDRTAAPPSPDQPLEFRKKDGSLSKMRSHNGNIPVLPQTKFCPQCPAKFTRTTHLNRHMRTHTNERSHRCEICGAEFTRSDLLTRHKKTCSDPNNANRSRKKSCQPCSESKIKCDNKYPCSKCTSRGRECVFLPRRSSAQSSSAPVQASTFVPLTASPSIASSSTPSTIYAPTPETSYATFSAIDAPRILEVEEILPGISAIPSDFSFASPELLTKPPEPKGSPEHFSTVTSDSATDVDNPGPVYSHLSSMYSSDMFEPFFSTLFANSHSSPPTTATADDFSVVDLSAPRSGSPEEFPFPTRPLDSGSPISSDLFVNSLSLSPSQPAGSIMEGPSQLDNANAAEMNHYLYLFFSAFLTQMPLVHTATFQPEGKPLVLLNAMRACGALFVKTRKATNFITRILATAREALVQEFAKNPTDSTDQVHLILAVVLLQTIGLFHQKADQRASSSIYHGMLVMMIRRTNLMLKNASWRPQSPSDNTLEELWQDWATHEMTKRALLHSYLHDCCHCIYFALPPSYLPGEAELFLPCEDGLWRAQSATEWFLALQNASSYGDYDARLIGQSLPKVYALMCEPRLLDNMIPLNPFAHFVVIHAMLYQLFSICMECRLPKSEPVDQESAEYTKQQLFRLQYGLHNWVQNWLNSPESPRVEGDEEPPFIFHALPFYWLGQVSLLAYQEGLPPFEPNSPNNLNVDVRFKLVKQWLKHIRRFLKKSDDAPTLFWDELMKIRLQTWQLEVENDTTEDQEGVLAFFPDH